jgi:hypothetical protein
MGEIGYSADGAAWTKSVPNPLYAGLSNSGSFNCVAFGGGVYVAAGEDKDDVCAIIYSTGQ